ncbi:MAG: twin-arginine translocase subunit TatC [Candidatus Kapaibacterium sp.]
MTKNKKHGKEKGSTGLDLNFMDHLEELRTRIIWALVGVIIGSAIASIFINQIMEFVLLNPASSVNLKLQNLRPFGQPFLYFKVVIVCGIIISFPFILYQLWKFIAPGLYENERKWVSSITFFTSLCFMIGIVFAYFLMIPSMLRFAASFGSENIMNIIDINEYFSFITMMLLASGLLFEMPMVAYVLSRIGILSPQTMRKYRRHGIIIILILAAMLTPSPDPVSQLIFAVPLFGLYEISILISGIGARKYQKTVEL